MRSVILDYSEILQNLGIKEVPIPTIAHGNIVYVWQILENMDDFGVSWKKHQFPNGFQVEYLQRGTIFAMRYRLDWKNLQKSTSLSDNEMETLVEIRERAVDANHIRHAMQFCEDGKKAWEFHVNRYSNLAELVFQESEVEDHSVEDLISGFIHGGIALGSLTDTHSPVFSQEQKSELLALYRTLKLWERLPGTLGVVFLTIYYGGLCREELAKRIEENPHVVEMLASKTGIGEFATKVFSTPIQTNAYKSLARRSKKWLRNLSPDEAEKESLLGKIVSDEVSEHGSFLDIIKAAISGKGNLKNFPNRLVDRTKNIRRDNNRRRERENKWSDARYGTVVEGEVVYDRDTPEEKVIRTEIIKKSKEYIQQLPKEKRLVLKWRYGEGLSQEKIARRLEEEFCIEKDQSTISRWIDKIIKELREKRLKNEI